MIGSGLNKAIWNDFVNRFNVEITELYSAAEGNFNMSEQNRFNNFFN